jgi:hypothetical protein
LDLIENDRIEKVQSKSRPTTTNIRRLPPPGTQDTDGNTNITSNLANEKEKGRSEIKRNSFVYFQPQALKKKSTDIFKVDAEKIRRKCAKEFQASWTSNEKILGYGERPGSAVQLLDDAPMRFFNKDMEHEPFNVKKKQFQWYDQIKLDAKNVIKR